MKFNVGDRVVCIHDDVGVPGVITKSERGGDHYEFYSVLHTDGSAITYIAEDLRDYNSDLDDEFDIYGVLNTILTGGCVIRQAEPVRQLKICAEFNGICMHDREPKEKRITINVAEVVAVSESVIDVLGNTCIDVGNGTRFYVKETYDEVRNTLGWEV